MTKLTKKILRRHPSVDHSTNAQMSVYMLVQLNVRNVTFFATADPISDAIRDAAKQENQP